MRVVVVFLVLGFWFFLLEGGCVPQSSTEVALEMQGEAGPSETGREFTPDWESILEWRADASEPFQAEHQKEELPERHTELLPEPARGELHQTKGCSFPGMKTLALPFDYQAPRGDTFQYHFQVVRASQANAPYLIMLPGGPGGTSIGKTSSFPLGAVPPGKFHIVYTDPRGAGCNTKKEGLFPYDFHSIENWSRDIMSLLAELERGEGRPLTFYVYGASFGTVHATAVTHLLEKEKKTLPKAIVLEGVLGQADKDFQTYFKRFQEEWRWVQTLLTTEWKSKLNATTLPHANGKAWGIFLNAVLIQGYIPGAGHSLPVYLKASSAALGQALKNYERIAGLVDTTPIERARTVITCRELWGSYQFGRELKEGQFTAIGEDVCKGELTLRKKYDAKDWPVTVPIVYVQGERDPATPLASAQYHFQVQSQARRAFILMKKAAHAPLTVGLKSMGCHTQFWDAVLTTQMDFQTALKNCQFQTDVPLSIETKK